MKTSNDSGWKEASTKAFQQQFALNLRELNDPPTHWRFFLEELGRIKGASRVVDIGCGVGSFSKLLRMWHGNIGYIGYDYSEAAIKTAASMGAKNVIFLRIRITEKESYYEEYEAYGEINTYAFYHNEDKLAEIINDSRYAPPRFSHYSENMINLHMEYNDTN